MIMAFDSLVYEIQQAIEEAQDMLEEDIDGDTSNIAAALQTAYEYADEIYNAPSIEKSDLDNVRNELASAQDKIADLVDLADTVQNYINDVENALDYV